MDEPLSLSSCEQLDSDENLTFQERSWRWETVGRWFVVLLIAGAVAGLLGGGPLSRTDVATSDGSLRVEYPRFARTDATHRIVIHLGPGSVKNGQAEVWIDASLLEVLQIETIAPEPDGVELDRGPLLFRFSVTNTEGLAPIVMHVKTDGVSRHAGRVGVRDGEPVMLTLWLFP